NRAPHRTGKSMSRLRLAVVSAIVGSCSLGLAAQTTTPHKPAGKPAMAVSHTPTKPAAPSGPAIEEQNALVKQYCSGCHSEKGKAGGLSLVSFDASQAPEHAETSEKMIRKLRAGMMPPPGARRPQGDTLMQFAVALENAVDTAAV